MQAKAHAALLVSQQLQLCPCRAVLVWSLHTCGVEVGENHCDGGVGVGAAVGGGCVGWRAGSLTVRSSDEARTFGDAAREQHAKYC